VKRFAGLLQGGVGLVLAGCGATSPAPATWAPPPQSAATPIPPLPVSAQPDVELREAHVAVVHGQSVPFDGSEDKWMWPSLATALGPRQAGDVVTLDVARSVPVEDVLRAASTVGAADVRVQSLDKAGLLRAVEFRGRREGASSSGCHLAVFVGADGTLHVAAPGGRREVDGDRPAEILSRSLVEERIQCPIKYIAFGAESDGAPWGPVFDVVVAVDEGKSAGAARYVLGHALHRPR
jgi:hypothetical protein